MTEPGWAGSAPPDEKPDWLKAAAPPPAASVEATRSHSDTPSVPDEEWPAAAGNASRVNRNAPSAASFSLHDLTLNFFQPLCVSEPILRKAAVDEISKFLKQCATHPTEDSMKLLRTHYRTVVRLAQEAPFPEIRLVFRDLVAFLQGLKVDLPPVSVNQAQVSYFFQPVQAPEATEDVEVIRLLQDIFVRTGRVTHVDQVLAWHPSFHEKWFYTQHFLLRDAGPLQLPVRNYIAILAAARHKCQYLVRLQEEEFLLNGGDAKWLEGFQEAPKKYQNLMPLIALLAHQPWVLNKDHISALVRGADSWTIAELVHAICLIVTFTSLSSLILATGITPEIDLPGPELQNASDSGDERADVDVINEQKKILAELLKKRTPKDEKEKEKEKERVPEESKVEMFVKAGEDNVAALHTSLDAASLSRYIGPHAMAHADFDVRSRDYRPLRDVDYTWQEQGYSLVSRYYAELAPLIDEEFRHIYNMTYNTFSDENNIDTSPFRFSIWHYVHRLKGLLHDDYNYRDVNTYLSKQLKTFIKKVACAPETIVRGDLNKIGTFTPAEKVHIVLLATESRKQAELTYGLNALMKQMR